MSPVFDSYLQHEQVTRMPSRHQKSVTMGQLHWPQGHSRGAEGAGGRRGDWKGASQSQGTATQEPAGLEALQRRLRIDVNSPVSLLSCRASALDYAQSCSQLLAVCKAGLQSAGLLCDCVLLLYSPLARQANGVCDTYFCKVCSI